MRPWRVSAAIAACALAGAVAMAFLVGRLLPREPVAATLLAGATLAVLAPGFLPIHCRVDADGVARRGLLAWERRSWAEIREVRLGARGLFVSPYPGTGRLERLRGLFLPLPGGLPGRDSLLERLRQEAARHGL